MLLAGVTVPLITPLNQDESLDEDGLARAIEYMLAGGVNGIFLLGSSGEFANLSRATKDALIRAAASLIGKRAHLYVGIARASAQATIEEGRHVQALGVPLDAFVTLPPFYFSHQPDELVTHFEMIASALDLPIILYNIPGMVKHTLTPQVVARLAEHPNIIGLKNTSTDMAAFHELIKIRDSQEGQFLVSQGDLPNAVECLVQGADGITLGVASLAPHWCSAMFAAARQGNLQEANAYLARLMHVDPVGISASWFAGLKYQCSLLGICQPYIARPFAWPGEKDAALLRQKLLDERLLDPAALKK